MGVFCEGGGGNWVGGFVCRRACFGSRVSEEGWTERIVGVAVVRVIILSFWPLRISLKGGDMLRECCG